MNLNIDKWGTFKIKDIFPKRKINKYSSIPDCDGDVPFISSTSENNGVAVYCDIESIPRNCITVSTNGKSLDAFFHTERIAVSSDVEVLYSENLNVKSALFICTVIKWNKYKFNYGRKAKSGKLFDLEIKLPQTVNGEPDWDFMENYIKSLKHKQITTKNLFSGWGQKLPILGIENWKEYKLGDLFKKIYKSQAYVKSELCETMRCVDTSINFVSRTEMNNGCDCYIEKEKNFIIEKGNAITIGDTTSTIFYQKDEFITGDHIVICRANWLNLFTGLFVKTIIERERFRYHYGRAFKIPFIYDTKIKLPSKNGEPDWKFMENYIKSLPFGDKIGIA